MKASDLLALPHPNKSESRHARKPLMTMARRSKSDRARCAGSGSRTSRGALLFGGKLSLRQLGRSLTGVARVKHQIKAVDRLLGNQHLHRERADIYRALARTLLAGTRRPLIIVDWSDFELDRQWVMLKAAVPVGGRAPSRYTSVFSHSNATTVPALISNSCETCARSCRKDVARFSSRTLDSEDPGFVLSRPAAGTGSAEYETRSNTIARALVVGASPTHSIRKQPLRRATSAKLRCLADIATSFGST